MICASMQDFPLTLHHILWRLEKLFRRKTVVSRRDVGVHRYTYGQALARIGQCAAALRRLGVQPGDRVATLAWNNYRHLELYYAVPCMGAVIHTLNLRLFPDQLQFVIQDAGDTVLCVDRSLLPILERIAGRIPSVRHIVVLDDDRGADLPPSQLGELLDYETLLDAESSDLCLARRRRACRRGDVLHVGHDRRPEGRRLLPPLPVAARDGLPAARLDGHRRG